jgi:hypothetical protein
MKQILKQFILKFINFNFKILVKQIIKDKAIMPHNIIDDVYEIFDNINQNKQDNKKILTPYEDITLLNKINIYKPYEILEIQQIKKNQIFALEINQTKDMILPLIVLDKNNTQKENDNIVLSYDNKDINLELKYKNRIHYLPIKNDKYINSIKIKSDKNDIAIGKPIYKDKPLLKDKPKLIVHIFIDALTQCMIEKFGYEIMPNTKKFFSNGGTFYTNAYAQAEWTLSSMAGILTGKYTNEHLLYHPRREDKIKDTTIADVLSQEGYNTFACTNIPKLTAINGYDKGFDRYILAIDKDYNYIINEAIEQLDAIGGNQYQFLSFFDIHELHTLQSMSSQVNSGIENFKFKKLRGNSKSTDVLYDEERINMYKNSITHFDKKLKRLYDMIESYDKDAMVIFHSDHGVNFMTKTTELLGKEREKVVFLYKNNKEHKIDNNIKEIRELPSMICDDLDINNPFDYIYKGYAITESLYPNKEYEIAIRTDTKVLFFKVPWSDVSVFNIKDFGFTTSYHLLEDETKEIKEDDELKRLLGIVKRHYLILIKNIQDYKEI